LNIFKFIQMMILGLVIIVMIILIVFISNTEKDELETVIDLFDKSNEITVISSKLNEYIANNHYTKGKHFLMFSIIRSLTNKKKLQLTIAMRQYFIKNNLQITMEIIDNNITTYRSNLNSKLSQILHLDNSIITVV